MLAWFRLKASQAGATRRGHSSWLVSLRTRAGGPDLVEPNVDSQEADSDRKVLRAMKPCLHCSVKHSQLVPGQELQAAALHVLTLTCRRRADTALLRALEEGASLGCAVIAAPGPLLSALFCCRRPPGAEQPPGCGDRSTTDTADRRRWWGGCWLTSHAGQGCL